MKIRTLITLLCAAVLLYSCGNGGNYEVLDNATTDTALVAADINPGSETKLVKTADMSFTVKSVAKTGEDISALTRSYKGMVTHHRMQSYVQNVRSMQVSRDSVMRISAIHTTADMTVKVPSEKLEDFMNMVSHMGTYIGMRNMDIEDESLIYLQSQLKLNSRKQLVSQQAKGDIKLKHAEDILIFKDALVDEQINTRRIDDAVRYSTLQLSFSQNNDIIKEVLVNSDPSVYRASFINRLGIALSAGVNLFADICIMLAHLWVFALLVIIIWLLIWHYRRRHPQLMGGNPFNNKSY